MSKIDLNNINVILATDCGSTTTKAILIQKIDGQYRQTHRGEAPSTVEEPFYYHPDSWKDGLGDFIFIPKKNLKK